MVGGTKSELVAVRRCSKRVIPVASTNWVALGLIQNHRSMATRICFLTLLALLGFHRGIAQQSLQGVDVYDRGEGRMFSNRTTGYGLQLRAMAQLSSEVRHFVGTDET